MTGKTMKAAIAGLAVFALLASAAIAQTQGEGRRHGMGGGMWGQFLGRVAQELELTEAQKQQIRGVIQAESPTLRPLLQQLREQHSAIENATAGGKFDEAQVRTLATQQSQTMAQLMVERHRIQSKIYNTILTAEQRSKVDEWRAKKASRMQNWEQKMEGLESR